MYMQALLNQVTTNFFVERIHGYLNNNNNNNNT